MDNNFNNYIFQICRTCMREITDACFFYLDSIPAANTQLTIRQKLYYCMPELDLNIVLNPVICSKCVNILVSVYEFKKNCLQSEIQINKYIQQVQFTGDLNLVEVLRFHQPHIKNFDIKIKMEDLENEDLVCNTSVFNEASECTESTEPKYSLKLEKIDPEYVLFNTFDDFNSNYNLTAAEESLDTHCSNIAQNCLSEVIEHRDIYNKNLNKTNEIISKRLSRCKNVFYYGCSLCNYLTKYQCLFDFHNRIHLTKKHYKCIYKHGDICTKAFRTTIKVDNKNMMGNKRKSVKNCNNRLSHYNNLKRNMRTRRAQKSFKCSICEYCCNCKVNLKRHMQLHIGEKRFACSVCEYQCNFEVNLKQHIMIHTGEKPFSCSTCEFQCSRKHDLKRHILIHTGVKPFSCSICEYQCSRKHDLQRHILIHTGAKPFSCSVCEYRCRQKQDLKKHMRIHTGEKPFSCSVCGYQFNRNEHLKQHMQIHTGEKPFSCSVCEYQCTQESNLKQHMRIHTGEKPFSCSICEYQCSWKSVLKQHILIHTGEKPFSCSICEYQCRWKTQLIRHMRIHTE